MNSLQRRKSELSRHLKDGSVDLCNRTNSCYCSEQRGGPCGEQEGEYVVSLDYFFLSFSSHLGESY